MKSFNSLARIFCTCLPLMLLVAPVEALADQYSCYSKRVRGPIVVEASSNAEAQYKATEQNPSRHQLAFSCRNDSVEKSEDIFVRDIRFNHQHQLRPYLPADLKDTGKPQFTCDSAGGFLPDGSKDHGGCHELNSPSTGAIYKIRFSSGFTNGLTSQVWKREGGGWKSWVEFHHSELKSASADAQKYAAAHGATQQGTAKPTDTSAPPPPAESQMENAVKKGVGDMLKGFGR